MLVKDRMTPEPVTITPFTSFPEAVRIMREKEIRHLPVMEEDKLVGVVSWTDLLHALPSMAKTLSGFETNYLLANLHIQEVMSSPAITVPEDAPLEEVARLMVDEEIGCLPVVRNGAMVGLITEADIFETFVEILGGENASLRVTVRIREKRGELARLAGMISGMGGDICSVARFRGEDPTHCYMTFRLEGIDEEVLVPAMRAGVEEIVHVCLAC